jgi:hypothetical protein
MLYLFIICRLLVHPYSTVIIFTVMEVVVLCIVKWSSYNFLIKIANSDLGNTLHPMYHFRWLQLNFNRAVVVSWRLPYLRPRILPVRGTGCYLWLNTVWTCVSDLNFELFMKLLSIITVSGLCTGFCLLFRHSFSAGQQVHCTSVYH